MCIDCKDTTISLRVFDPINKTCMCDTSYNVSSINVRYCSAPNCHYSCTTCKVSNDKSSCVICPGTYIDNETVGIITSYRII
jgi:hypothetical protein